MADNGRGKKWMLFFILAGVIVLLYSANVVYRGASSYSWPYCRGKVISSEIQLTKRMDPG